MAQVAATEQAWDEARLLALLDELQGPPLLLILDGVTDPHNLGACLRSADAAGVHAVITPRDKSADLTPVVQGRLRCGRSDSFCPGDQPCPHPASPQGAGYLALWCRG